jgi:pyruvate/2-oxoglutarate dehydrogenase complex dihydrolipoamide dehydrogenase (E3) component
MVSSQGQSEEYDLLILGSGAGSKLLAWTFAGRGQRVAVVERKYVGGSCPNIACLPSKNIIHTAQVAHNVRRSEEFGISVDGFRSGPRLEPSPMPAAIAPNIRPIGRPCTS